MSDFKLTVEVSLHPVDQPRVYRADGVSTLRMSVRSELNIRYYALETGLLTAFRRLTAYRKTL